MHTSRPTHILRGGGSVPVTVRNLTPTNTMNVITVNALEVHVRAAINQSHGCSPLPCVGDSEEACCPDVIGAWVSATAATPAVAIPAAFQALSAFFCENLRVSVGRVCLQPDRGVVVEWWREVTTVAFAVAVDAFAVSPTIRHVRVPWVRLFESFVYLVYLAHTDFAVFIHDVH